MKDWTSELNVTEMTWTFGHSFLTSLTFEISVDGWQASTRSMTHERVYSLPIRGSMRPPTFCLPFSSITSGCSILATEYAFCRVSASILYPIQYSSIICIHDFEPLATMGELTTTMRRPGDRNNTYNLLRAHYTKLDFPDLPDRRGGVWK